MQRLRKIDQTHTVDGDKVKSMGRSRNKNYELETNDEKVVGIKIDTESLEYQDKVYYYKTSKDFKVGDKINVVMPTKGHPDCVVTEVDDIANSKYKSLKELELFK